MALALCAMNEAFTFDRVFYVRDLGFFWWPQHLWAAAAFRAGEFPLWDPSVGLGQSAIADPIRHLLFPPVLALRLLLPPVVSFNLSVALPFPLAALGTYLFLARRCSPQAASLGGALFAVSGPMLSNGAMLTNAWTLALVPWVLWATDRLWDTPTARRWALLSTLFALQILAGEPVSLLASLALTGAYAVFAGAPERASVRDRARVGALVVAAGALGLALAAAQALPLVDAVSRSSRAQAVANLAWPVHPLNLVECVTGPVFGDPFGPWSEPVPMLRAMYAGALPYLYSLYIGVGAIALAMLGALVPSRRTWAIFWTSVGALFLVLALGDFTPVYPTIQALVPFTRTFRYPAKFIVLATFAGSVLAAGGWDALRAAARDARLHWVVLIPIALASFALWIGVGSGPDLYTWVASLSGVARPELAGELLADAAANAMPRLVLVSAGCAALLWFASRSGRASRAAAAALFTLVVADPLMANLRLNPTIDAEFLGEPAWVSRLRELPPGRLYVGGRTVWLTELDDADAPPERPEMAPPETPRTAVAVAYQAALASYPGAWGLREAISVDLTSLWPTEYRYMVGRFGASPPEARDRYLRRAWVRYFVTPRAPTGGGREIARLGAFGPTALYEGPLPSPRAAIVTESMVLPEANAQTDRLFSEDFDPASVVLLEAEPPPPAGRPGPHLPASAEVVRENTDEVDVGARVPGTGGYLLLADSFAPGWRAEVDGEPAPVLRANGLFRAVRLTPGEHMVRFVYRPRAFYAGAAVSALATLLLVALVIHPARTGGRSARPARETPAAGDPIHSGAELFPEDAKLDP